MAGGDGDAGWRAIEAEESRRLLTDQIDQLLEAPVDHQSGCLVVEVGCGDGRATDVLWGRLERRWGQDRVRLVAADVDLARVLAARDRLQARRSSGVRLIVADLFELPFAEGRGDYYVALNVAYLVDRSALLAEAARVLSSEGKLLLYDLIPKGRERRWFPFSLCLRRAQLVSTGESQRDEIDRLAEST